MGIPNPFFCYFSCPFHPLTFPLHLLFANTIVFVAVVSFTLWLSEFVLAVVYLFGRRFSQNSENERKQNKQIGGKVEWGQPNEKPNLNSGDLCTQLSWHPSSAIPPPTNIFHLCASVLVIIIIIIIIVIIIIVSPFPFIQMRSCQLGKL